MCEERLLFFARYIFAEHLGQRFIVSEHHQQIVDMLAAIERREVANAVINLPPRYTKTELVVVMWMAHSFARNPSAKFIHVSYSDELALLNSARVREILQSAAFQRFWPIQFKDGSESKKLWETQAGGGVKAGAAGGPVTGFGAGQMSWKPGDPFDGAIIIDDPLKPGDAKSEVKRATVNDRLRVTLRSRRNHRQVPMVIVMQCLHEEDPSGYALSGKVGLSFEHLSLKALRDDGTALWPKMHTVEELEKMRTDDRSTFSSQYQQEPTPDGGLVFRLEWFGRYNHAPKEPDAIIHSWDTAYKAGEHNDPSCCTVWAVMAGVYYLLACHVGRWEYPELKHKAKELAAQDKVDAILIEDKASGQSLIQDLKRESNLPVIAITPVGDKETRARTQSAMIEAGKVLIPNMSFWLHDFEKELVLFPNAAHDDRVDSLSQFLAWAKVKYRGSDVTGQYARILEEFYAR